MTLDDIPADERVKMTTTMERLFKIAGCNPACHCCSRKIPVGAFFKLAKVEDSDEMLCSWCTPEKLLRKRAKMHQEWLAWKNLNSGNGYTRKHL